VAASSEAEQVHVQPVGVVAAAALAVVAVLEGTAGPAVESAARCSVVAVEGCREDRRVQLARDVRPVVGAQWWQAR